jgi:hypothetical protein
MVSTSPALRKDVESSAPTSGQKQHIASAPTSIKDQRNFVVPVSGKKQRGDSDASTTPSQRKLRLDLKRMNPSKRTNDWLKKTETPAKCAHQSNVLGVKNSKVTKPAARALSSRKGDNSKPQKKLQSKVRREWWFFRVWSYLFSKKKDDKFKDDSPEGELEGNTVIGDSTPSKPHITHNAVAEGETLNQSTNLEGDTTLIGDDNPTPSGGKPTREGKDGPTDDANQFRGWTEDEVWLWQKLDWRGYEPLLPKSWDGDFRTMYDELFSEDDSVTFIKSTSGNDYHGRLFCCRVEEKLANCESSNQSTPWPHLFKRPRARPSPTGLGPGRDPSS